MKAAVVGAGSWGTALANLLAHNGARVSLWARTPALAAAMRRERRNTRYLPEAELEEAVEPTSDLAEAVRGAALVVSATPSHAVREVMAGAAPHVGGTRSWSPRPRGSRTTRSSG